MPSWTDRVLWLCNKANYSDFDLDTRQHSYAWHPAMADSDHKPVSATFTTARFNARLAVERAMPAFGPIVSFDRPVDWEVGQIFSLTYRVKVGQLFYCSPWDWIGLYKVNSPGALPVQTKFQRQFNGVSRASSRP